MNPQEVSKKQILTATILAAWQDGWRDHVQSRFGILAQGLDNPPDDIRLVELLTEEDDDWMGSRHSLSFFRARAEFIADAVLEALDAEPHPSRRSSRKG